MLNASQVIHHKMVSVFFVLVTVSNAIPSVLITVILVCAIQVSLESGLILVLCVFQAVDHAAQLTSVTA